MRDIDEISGDVLDVALTMRISASPRPRVNQIHRRN